MNKKKVKILPLPSQLTHYKFQKLPSSRPLEGMDLLVGSTSASPCSSYQPSPFTSYNPSPASSFFSSPVSSTYGRSITGDGNSLVPWLRNLSASSSSQFMHGGSISPPVTPPLSSPTVRSPWIKTIRDNAFALPGAHTFLHLSTPPSPIRPTLPDSNWFARVQIPQSHPSSPTFSLVSSNPFRFSIKHLSRGGSLTCTPPQSGACYPAITASSDQTLDIPMAEVIANEFAFGSNATGVIKPWEGERIHDECIPDDLELTLGSSKTMYVSL